jgi:hypothetical protein
MKQIVLRIKKLPVSLTMLIVIATVFIIQAIPVVGEVFVNRYTIMFQAYMLNLMLITIAIEACLKRIHRVGIILPILFFGWYYGDVLIEKYTFASMVSDIVESNSSVRIPFDTQQNVVIFKTNYLFHANNLVENYNIPVAYSENKTTTAFSPLKYLAYRLVDSQVCRQMRSLIDENENAKKKMHYYLSINHIRIQPSGDKACIVAFPDEPSDMENAVVIHEVEKKRIEKSNIIIFSVENSTGNRQVLKISSGKHRLAISPALAIPELFFRCGTNSWNLNYNCTFQFRRGYHHLKDSINYYDSTVFGTALNLTKLPIDKRDTSKNDAYFEVWVKQQIQKINASK